MNLEEYFKHTQGFGVLATADSEGKVDLAFYSIPVVIDQQTIALVMRDKLSHKNLQSNPYCAYMFLENGKTFSGLRLYMTRLFDEKNAPQIDSLNKQFPKMHTDHLDESDKFLVYFKIDNIRPLEGDKKFTATGL